MDVVTIRTRLGLTQVQLAELTGVHPITVSKWERGVLVPAAHQLRILRSLTDATRGAGARSPHAAVGQLLAILNRAYLDASESEDMKLSASNQLKGRIVQMDVGPVSSRIVLEVAPGVRITSVITTASSKRLGLREGKRAVAIIKATEVILGVK
jgi:molybdopterin-binding protein